MRVAQVVITKTQQGNWKITAQSLQQVEFSRNRQKYADVIIIDLKDLMENHVWEQLSLD